MKQILHKSLLLAGLLSGTALIAQRKLTEATIVYNIVINTGNDAPKGVDALDGATSVVYLKGNSSRTEMVSSLGTEATIIDGKTGNVTLLKEYGEQKYMIKLTSANWKESNKKSEGIVFTYYDEYKTIAGYKCQKAVGQMADSTVFTVYFTKDLIPANKDFQYLNKNLPGLALQYEAVIRKKGATNIVTYTVASVNLTPVVQSKFDLPKSGYRVMTYEESMSAGG
jgi:GLPGLI family protein